jgi:hypothetical protein
MRIIRLFAALPLLALPACSLLAAKTSWTDPQLTASDTGPLAAAMARMLAERFTPGKTTFVIVPAPDGNITEALTAKLRSAGFAVASAGTPGAQTIRLVITAHGKDVVVRILAGKLEASQVFARDDKGVLAAAAPVTLRDGGAR